MESKFCKGCEHWEKQDKTTEAYMTWKDSHVCERLEPWSLKELLRYSLSHGLQYKWLISNSDSKTHLLLLHEQPYEKDHLVEKIDCVGHVQKRMGTLLYTI